MSQKKESILDKIVIQRKLDVIEAKKNLSESELINRLVEAPKVINFLTRLSSSTMSVIGEIKRASPSKGDIDTSINAQQQAILYSEGGASAISVLTEPTWFKGTLDDLRGVREAVEIFGENRPALLRKDFIFDNYQVYEARYYGADTILLIVAILTDEEIKNLMTLSRELGMEPLVEVNTEDEMKRALQLGAKIIGVNNRNLHTFQVDMDTTTTLAKLISKDIILAALSGISNRADVVGFQNSGASAVLVGEALMRSHEKKLFIKNLLGQE